MVDSVSHQHWTKHNLIIKRNNPPVSHSHSHRQRVRECWPAGQAEIHSCHCGSAQPIRLSPVVLPHTIFIISHINIISIYYTTHHWKSLTWSWREGILACSIFCECEAPGVDQICRLMLSISPGISPCSSTIISYYNNYHDQEIFHTHIIVWLSLSLSLPLWFSVHEYLLIKIQYSVEGICWK